MAKKLLQKKVVRRVLWSVREPNGEQSWHKHNQDYSTVHIYKSKKLAKEFAHSGRYVVPIEIKILPLPNKRK